MARTSFDLLSRRVSGIIQQLHSYGVQDVVSEEDAWRLFDETWRLHHHHSSPDAQGLLVRASLISHVVFAVKEVPDWRSIAITGAYPDGSLWFAPTQPEVKRLYALLLTNCAVACCMQGGDLQGRILPLVNTAYNFFQQLDFARADRWVGTLYAALAYREGDETARAQYAGQAWRLLEPLSLVSEELRVYVKRLAGLGDGKITEPGLLGTRWRSRSRDAFFSTQDLYLFGDL